MKTILTKNTFTFLRYPTLLDVGLMRPHLLVATLLLLSSCGGGGGGGDSSSSGGSSSKKPQSCAIANGSGHKVWDKTAKKYSTTCTITACDAGYDNVVDKTQCQKTAADYYSPTKDKTRKQCSTTIPDHSLKNTATGSALETDCWNCKAGSLKKTSNKTCMLPGKGKYYDAQGMQQSCSDVDESPPGGFDRWEINTAPVPSDDKCKFSCKSRFTKSESLFSCNKSRACQVNNGGGLNLWDTNTNDFSTTCTLETCNAGYDNSQNPTQCQPTAARFYSPANAKARTACPPTPNNSSPTTTTELANPQGCFDCNAGYWKNLQGSCDVPDLGKWVDATENAKKDCTIVTHANFDTWIAGAADAANKCSFSCSGAYSADTSARICVTTTQSCSLPNGSGTQTWDTQNNRYGTCTITACDAGYDNTQDSAQCQQTAANFYSPANNNARTDCPTPSDSTPTARTGLSSADGCFTCDDAGYDNTQDPTQCQQTAANFYSPANNNARTDCPTPSDSTPTARTGLSSADGCFTCDDAGYDNTQDPTQCQPTATNFYSPANVNTRTACPPVPNNSSPTIATGLVNPQGCFSCNAGFWKNPQGNGSCDVPDLGKWVDATKNEKKDCSPVTHANFDDWVAGAADAANKCRFSCSGPYSPDTSARSCVTTTQSCSITDGSGTQTWGTQNNLYGTCTITACDAGFDNDQDSTQCQATAAAYYSPANNNARTACPTPNNSSPTTTTGLSSIDGCFTCSDGYFLKASTCEKIEPDAFALGNQDSYVLYNSGEVEGWGKVSSDPWVFNRKIDLGTVNGTKNKAQAIESGSGDHRCIILKNGTNDHGAVKCWGVNTYEQLGIVGNTTDRDTPTDITALGNDASSTPYTAKSLAVGYEHVCAILNDDKVKCWGRNNYGQIGGGSGSDITVSGTPGDPLGGGTATAIAAYHYTCAILNNGKVKCWGNNAMGSTDGGTPNLGNGRTATALAAGAGYSCALKDDQSIGCWGWKGDTIIQGLLSVPVKERFSPFTDTATQIGTGVHSFCAILTDKIVKCFNVRLHYGDIGGSATNRSANRVVKRGTAGDPLEGETAVSIAMGKEHTCALTETDKSIKCWGKNDDGQIIGTLINMEGGTDGTGTSTGATGVLTANATPSASALETDIGGKVCGLAVTDATNGIALQYATPLTYNSLVGTTISDAIDNLITVVGTTVKLGGTSITLTKHADADKIEATVDIPIFDGMTLNIMHDNNDGDCASSSVTTQIPLRGSTTTGTTAGGGLWVISANYTYSSGADQLINLDGVEIDLGGFGLTKEEIADNVVGKVNNRRSWEGLQDTHLPYSAAKIDGDASTTDDCPAGDYCVEFTRIFKGTAGNNGIPFGDVDYEKI